VILDHLDRRERYIALHPRFAHAFAWLDLPANRDAKDGKYEIEGQDLFVLVQTGATGPAQDKRFESHRRYIDIQVTLRGPEVMLWHPAAALSVIEAYSPEHDVAFYADPPHYTPLVVEPEHFAIFYPDDGHKPGCALNGKPAPLRKAVFKVAVLDAASRSGRRPAER
jgi:biofilm protein TabA